MSSCSRGWLTFHLRLMQWMYCPAVWPGYNEMPGYDANRILTITQLGADSRFPPITELGRQRMTSCLRWVGHKHTKDFGVLYNNKSSLKSMENRNATREKRRRNGKKEKWLVRKISRKLWTCCSKVHCLNKPPA